MNVTVPLPLPLAPAVIVIHATPLVALHAQPAAAVTVVAPGPPGVPMLPDVGFTTYVHGGGGVVPACAMVTVWPATPMDPARLTVVGFAAIVNVTDPLPVPLAPPVIVIHGTLLTAVHGHAGPVVTVVAPGPPAEPIDPLVGFTT
jgi:hypothetical protein